MKAGEERAAVAYFLVGPTAVGKSEIAHRIAVQRGYDVLSADSMQVYTGMDIGTAKPSERERREARYHGLDLVTPDLPYSVWQYRQYAAEVVRDNARAGRTTIVTGGSGLYIKSMTNGLDDARGFDPALREKYQQILDREGLSALQSILKERNASAFEALADKQNPRRVLRALEKLDDPIIEQEVATKAPRQTVPLVGLTMAAQELKSRIESRVVAMYRAGLIEETRGIIERWPQLSPTARQAIGYAEAAEVAAGRIAERDAIARTVARTVQLAKRQRTWFRGQARVEWIELKVDYDPAEIAEKVCELWSKYGPVEIAD